MGIMVEISQQDRDVRVKLLQAAKAQNVSMAQLSALIGRNSAYMSQFMGRFTPRKLEERDRRKLAEFLGLSERDLGAPEEKSYDAGSGADWVDIPRLDLGASAGPGAAAGDPQAFDNFRFSERWVREMGLEAGALSAIRVRGDSMEPLLRDGDDVIVDCRDLPFRDGVHVVRMDDNLLVKRIAAQGQGRLTLLSQNMAYPPVDVRSEDVEIIGRVVWKGGRI